jgi:hypothetical protein
MPIMTVDITMADCSIELVICRTQDDFLQEVEKNAYRVLSGEVRCFTPYLAEDDEETREPHGE